MTFVKDDMSADDRDGRCRSGRQVFMLFIPVGVILCACVLVILAGPVWGMSSWEWKSQVYTAGGVTSATALAGSFITVLVWKRAPLYLGQGILAASCARLLLTLGAILLIALAWESMRKAFFLSAGGFYIIGLISETVLAVKAISWSNSCSRAADQNKGWDESKQ